MSNDTVLYAIATKNLCRGFAPERLIIIGTRSKESGFLNAPESGEALVDKFWELTKFEKLCSLTKPVDSFYAYEKNIAEYEKGLAPWIAKKCDSMSGQMRLAEFEEFPWILN